MSAYDYYKFYLKPEDLLGKAHVVKISKVYPVNFFGEKKLVMEFEGKRKALKVSAAQAEDMMTITGTEHERQWIGTEITLTDVRVFNGKHTIGIGTSQPRQVTAQRNAQIVVEAK